MTPNNREKNAEDELDRAEQCLRESEVLRQAGLPYGAASRAYFAVFHAARGLLFSIGLESRSHRGMVGLLGEHFVRTGRMSAETARLLSRLQRDREDSDYEAGAVFTDSEADTAIADARRFLDAVKTLLVRQ